MGEAGTEDREEHMSAEVSAKTMLILAAVATFAAAAFAPTSASAWSRAQSFAQVVKGPAVQPNRWVGWCFRGPACHPPNAIFVRPGNLGNAVFAN
jgi:hypothetical protein